MLEVIKFWWHLPWPLTLRSALVFQPNTSCVRDVDSLCSKQTLWGQFHLSQTGSISVSSSSMHAANMLRAKVAGIIQECRVNAPSLWQFICLVSVMTVTKFLMLKIIIIIMVSCAVIYLVKMFLNNRDLYWHIWVVQDGQISFSNHLLSCSFLYHGMP